MTGSPDLWRSGAALALPRRCHNVPRMGRGQLPRRRSASPSRWRWPRRWSRPPTTCPCATPTASPVPTWVRLPLIVLVAVAPRRRRAVAVACTAHGTASRWLAGAALGGPRALDAGAGEVHRSAGSWRGTSPTSRSATSRATCRSSTDRLWDPALAPARPPDVVGPRPGRGPARRARHRLGRLAAVRRLRALDRVGAGLARRRAGLDPRARRRRPGTSPRSPSTGCSARPSTTSSRPSARSTPRPRSSPTCPARSTPRCRTCCSTTASRCWPTLGHPRRADHRRLRVAARRHHGHHRA